MKRKFIRSCCALIAALGCSLALIETVLACSEACTNPGPAGTGVYECFNVPSCQFSSGHGDNVATCVYNSNPTTITCWDGDDSYQKCAPGSETSSADPCGDAPNWPGLITCTTH